MCSSGVMDREDVKALTDAELEALIGEVARTLEISTHRMHVLTAEHGERRLFERHGHVNEGEYLQRRHGLTRQESRRLAHQGRVLARHPYLAAAHADGRITADRLDLLLRAARGRTADVFIEDEETLVDKVAAASSLRDAERILTAWLDTVTADGSPPPNDNDTDFVDESKLFDDLLLQARLSGENAEAVSEELDRLTDQIERADKVAGIHRSRAARKADALALMAVRSASAGGRPATRPLVVLVMTHAQWEEHKGATFSRTGFPASTETVERNLCSSVLCRFVTDATGQVIDMGRDARTNTETQRAARIVRDGTCVFGDCDVPAGDCHGHHATTDWHDGGHTDMADLGSLCPPHHRLAHEGGWKLHRHADGSWTATSRDGLTITRPPPTGDGQLDL
jgi:hypothetical protein